MLRCDAFKASVEAIFSGVLGDAVRLGRAVSSATVCQCLLLRLSADSGRERKKSQPILPHISQADLASMIGATRGRVNRFMNEFRRLSLIDYNRGGYVTVHKRLAKVMGDR